MTYRVAVLLFVLWIVAYIEGLNLTHGTDFFWPLVVAATLLTPRVNDWLQSRVKPRP